MNYIDDDATEAQGEFLGQFNNNWRSRLVKIFRHKTDPTKVVTEGWLHSDGTLFNRIIEERSAYHRNLDANDWSDYN